MSFLFSPGESINCENCGYKIVKPYPKDKICPKCGKPLTALMEKEKVEEEEAAKAEPKQFETKSAAISTKLQGKVRVKKKVDVSLESDKIELQKGEYIKLLGISSVNRTPLFCSNKNYIYFLELTNNLDFIATSILGGELDKMLLISESGEQEKCQFYVKDDIIYIVYGIFPDKKGKWILEQMENHYSEEVKGKDVDNLDKLEKYNLEKKFDGVKNFIIKEYLKMQDVFSDQEIPYVEDKIRLDYLGLSSKSIGVISLLMGEDLNVDVPGQFDNPDEEKEMKESLLTAKIEAIAANTIGNTGAMPRWIAVKLGFQNYRFLTFQKYDNNYFLYLLSEGNLGKIDIAEADLKPLVGEVTTNPFSGNLRPFNKLKLQLDGMFSKSRTFT